MGLLCVARSHPKQTYLDYLIDTKPQNYLHMTPMNTYLCNNCQIFLLAASRQALDIIYFIHILTIAHSYLVTGSGMVGKRSQ